MFRGDVVSDTTPEVRRLLHDIDAADAAESCHSSLAPPAIHGHILLSGLPRVATLARQRALLLHETTRAATDTATSTAAASVSAAGSDAVFVRLVLSLLSSSHTVNFVSPPITTTAASGAADALSNVSLDNEADAALSTLPWTSTHMPEINVADVALEGQCCHEDGGVGGFPCRVALTSYPVPVLTPATTRSLAHHWRSTRPITLNNDTGEKREEEDATAAATCLATAMDEFHVCVRVHELRSLRAIAKACEELLRYLEQDQQQQTSTARESPVEVRISVPLYGVVLDVDDNQTTRLEQVSDVTTPLLRAATGEESALRPLTVALQQLRAWRAKGETLQLTQSRLCRLRDYVTLFIHSQLDAVASASTVGVLDVLQSCAADLLLPASLVHCQLGVSRSPSVVLLFYMSVFRTQWCRAALRRTQQSVSAEDTLTGDAMTVADTHIDPAAAVEVFYSLRNALVRARPRVKPNVCFAVQLLSLWRRCIAS